MLSCKVTGGALIFLGLLSLIVQILVLNISTIPGLLYTKEEGYATGIWAGCFFVAAGAAAIWFAMGESEIKRKIVMVSSGISLAVSIAQIAIASVVLKYINEDLGVQELKKLGMPILKEFSDHLILNSFLVAAGVFALVMSVLQLKQSLSK